MISWQRTAGNAAENRVLDYLVAEGLQLVQRNYACRNGEIDLIMQHQGQLVFVEVRYRKRTDFGGALESVTAAKQRKLILTAQHYLQQLNNIPDCRFDVVGTDPSGKMHWIRDAFQTQAY